MLQGRAVPGTVARIGNPHIRKAEGGGWPHFQGQPGLHSEVQASLNDTARPFLKKENKNKGEKKVRTLIIFLGQ